MLDNFDATGKTRMNREFGPDEEYGVALQGRFCSHRTVWKTMNLIAQDRCLIYGARLLQMRVTVKEETAVFTAEARSDGEF
jgi:hypothetical protein